MPGLEANIQPLNRRGPSAPSWISVISRKVEVSGVSSGGRFRHLRGDAAENNRLADGNGQILRPRGDLVERPEDDNLPFRPFVFLLELGLGLRE